MNGENSNEKFADIIAEQRHLAKSFKWKPAVRRRLKLIDRLEAAHKREVEELRNGISELLNALKTIYDEECTDYGTGEVYDKWRKFVEVAK